ncbi:MULTISPECIES: N-acetyltransferase [Micromonospora]|uniref:GNAT family N-acetyltransferase n=1 Tax=Micromonospora solifontis TaxID=2487138 RepID=A0ABX9WA53_9ACTN|nr:MULTISPECIES: GNAT family N-acetyltransferase [Micromonospora]NES16310.1 GNAT family N-acetyltransferase [Micromonospora sp. PPF5-17B]NES39080.1 GNAT family N-acetyltransferase [Micromonospora solifontis]NES58122.1 GNAT family N-acetyltransferase [Micromonospora sp. PPF5-6]RNL91365.1 GNAT family N-acetyltransferase [Micromonospora solifontis]
MLENLRLRRYDTEQAQQLVDQLVDVYLDAHSGDGPLYNAERYQQQLAVHMPRVGWELVAATIDAELVGYIYGFPLASDTRWWDGVQEPVPAGFTKEDGRRTFAVSELLVRRGWQRRGIARALHDELVGSRREERVTLLVRPDNTAARNAYRTWGWQSVAKLRPDWENAPTFMVLVRMRDRHSPRGAE